MIDKLKGYLAELKTLRKDVKAEAVKQIAKKDLRERAERLGTQWFTEFSSQLPQQGGISNDVLEKYSEGCARLIALSAPNTTAPLGHGLSRRHDGNSSILIPLATSAANIVRKVVVPVL